LEERVKTEEGEVKAYRVYARIMKHDA